MESCSSGEAHTYSQSILGHGEKWLVPHLWEAARGLPVFTVPILDLPYILDCSWLVNWRNQDDPDVKAEAERTAASDLSYPVILHPHGHLMDGYHRVCKALQMGQTTIQAVKFTEANLPAPDWSWTKCASVKGSMSSSNTSYVDTAKERNALRSILRLFLDGSIERCIDQIEQKTTYRVFGPVGWTDPFKHLSDALRAGGFIKEAEAEVTARTTCDPILPGDL